MTSDSRTCVRRHRCTVALLKPLLLGLAAFVDPTDCSAFAAVKNRPVCASAGPPRSDAAAAADRRESRGVQMNFEGVYETSSDPISGVTEEQLVSFFRDEEHRDLLLKGGDNPIDCLPMTPELLELWRDRSELMGTTAPRSTDPIVAIRSTAHVVPGLDIRAVSYMGCRFVQDPRTSLPVYEFTLLFDEYRAVGARPLVWLFNQITGEGSKRGRSSRVTTAVSRITMESTASTAFLAGRSKSSDGVEERGTVSMRYYGLIRVTCFIPKGVLRCLPASKQRVQEKVSKAMRKQLENEGTKSMEKVHAALREWIQKNASRGKSSETPSTASRLPAIVPSSFYPASR